jgi:hypothetical protein
MSELQKQIDGLEFKNIVAKLKAGKTLNSKEREIAHTRALEIDAGERFLTGAEIGKILGISRQAGDKKISNGCLVKNETELRAWEEERNNTQGKGANAPKSLNDARLDKLQLEAELLKWKVAREKGELIPVDQVREDIIAAVAAFTAELYALANDVPGQLAGLTETQIRDKVLARIDLLVDKVKAKCEDLGKARLEADESNGI